MSAVGPILQPAITNLYAGHVLAFLMAQKLAFVEEFGPISNQRFCRSVPYPICNDNTIVLLSLAEGCTLLFALVCKSHLLAAMFVKVKLSEHCYMGNN